jgi:hypothetical protein
MRIYGGKGYTMFILSQQVAFLKICFWCPLNKQIIEGFNELVVGHVRLNLNPFLHRYTFIAWANSVDPHQLAHLWIRIYIDATAADPDQMALCMWRYMPDLASENK